MPGSLVSNGNYKSLYSKIEFNGTPLVALSTINPITLGVKDGATVSTGEEAILAGGEHSSGLWSAVYRIDKSLTYNYVGDLVSFKKLHTGVKIWGLASFAGGRNNGSDFFSVDGFNPKTGERVSLPEIYYARGNMAGASNGKESALIGGKNRGGGVFRTIDWYKGDFSRTHFDLDYAVTNASAGAIQGYTAGELQSFIFVAGGCQDSTCYNYVRRFDSGGTSFTCTNLSVPRKDMACGKIGDRYIVFACGIDANGVFRNEIDVYTFDGTRVKVLYIPVGVSNMVALSYENCVVFCCGRWATRGPVSQAYIIDESFTITTIDLNVPRYGGTAAVVGDYGLLLDGCTDSAQTSFVTEIQMLHVPQAITLPPKAKYKLNNMSTEATTTTFTAYPLTTPKLSGYIAIPNITV